MVSEAFVRFFVETVGHYSLFLAGEREERTLQREAFRKAVSSKSLRRFLEVFMETQMFRGFAQERELRRQDARGGGPSVGAGTAGQAQPAAAAEREDSPGGPGADGSGSAASCEDVCSCPSELLKTAPRLSPQAVSIPSTSPVPWHGLLLCHLSDLMAPSWTRFPPSLSPGLPCLFLPPPLTPLPSFPASLHHGWRGQAGAGWDRVAEERVALRHPPTHTCFP